MDARGLSTLMNTHETSHLTCGQWALLREVSGTCPLSLGRIKRLVDLRRLIEKGFVTVKQTSVCTTCSGMEALWYHHLH